MTQLPRKEGGPSMQWLQKAWKSTKRKVLVGAGLPGTKGYWQCSVLNINRIDQHETAALPERQLEPPKLVKHD